jgi:hypothetical protein
MKRKFIYQIPEFHLISSSDKIAMGYCSDGSGASQLTITKFCLAGFGPQPGAILCESGSGNVINYGECVEGPSHVVKSACETGNGEI